MATLSPFRAPASACTICRVTESPLPTRTSALTLARPSVVSFFSGGGGLDLGFRNAGFETTIALDIEPAAVATLNHNFGPNAAVHCDVRRFDAGLVEQHAGIQGGRVPVGVIGGPPCQGFSSSNVTLTPSDARNRLPSSYATAVAELNKTFSLDFFVFENVIGLLRDRHRRRLSNVIRALESAGFHVAQQELDAFSFGVAQKRRRLFLVGLNSTRFEASDFCFPAPRTATRTVRDAIGHLPEPTFFRRGITAKEISYHPNHWTMMPKSKRFKTKSFSRWRSFRKLEWDEPSPTVAYGNREIHVHPSGTRRLSVLEAMLLQGFPETYRLMGNLSEQVTQVSNAVPPPLAMAIASQLLGTLKAATEGHYHAA